MDNYPLGTSDVDNSLYQVKLFPNPNNGNFNIQFNGLDQDNGVVTIVDLNGKTVYVNSFEISGMKSSSRIDLSGLSKGIYLLNYASEKHAQNLRVVIQ